jgi:hypothetical protein
MGKVESYALGTVLQELTNGRPFVFVIMAYDSRFGLFEKIQQIVHDEVGLACIRADDVKGSGHDLLAKIHLLIERAELVIAEISKNSPNVFYEVGYAVAQQKTLLLLICKGKAVPTDLKGRELIEYRDTPDAMSVFTTRLREHLRVRVNSRVALLRDMLEAELPRPIYIVASPRYPRPTEARIKGQLYDHRTFGDNLGIRGLIAAFGSMFGETDGVELISAQYGPPDLVKSDGNLYLIGSDIVNPTTGKMLAALQKGREPKWHFELDRNKSKNGDSYVELYKTVRGKPKRIAGKMGEWGERKELIHTVDYGIIVRGPHPHRPGRMAMIMAGAHSLGTGAACLAATRSALIRQVKEALPDDAFADRSRTIWVLVKGKGSEEDRLLDEDGVEIVETGCWE